MQLNPRREIWRLQPTDIKFLFFNISLLVFCFYLLYENFKQKIDTTQKNEPIGTLILKKNLVQRKQNNQVVWEGAINQIPLYNLDTIRTGNNSSALLVIERDGGDDAKKENSSIEFDLASNTLIVLSFAEKQVNVNFSTGSIRVRQEKEGTQKLNILSGDKTISLDKGQLNLKKLDTGKLDIAVNAGKVDINTTKSFKKLTIDENSSISLDPIEDINLDTIQIKKTILFPKQPTDGKRIFAQEDGDTNIKFSWDTSQKSINAILIEVSTDEKFKNILLKQSITKNQTTMKLKQGDYYWRVSSLGPIDRKRTYSNAFGFSILSIPRLEVTVPEIPQKFSYDEEENPPLVDLSWKKNPLADSYEVEVSSDPNFKGEIQSYISEKTSISLPFTKGNYYWRVKSKSKIDVPELKSQIRSFNITKVELPQLPEINITDVKVAKLDIQEQKEIPAFNFYWKKTGKAKFYTIEVSADKDFKKIISKQLTRSNNANLTLPKESVGKYYWRVKSQNYKEGPAIESKAYDFEVESLEFPKLPKIDITKVKVQKVKLGEEQVAPIINFSWEKTGKARFYTIEISADKDFKKIISQKQSTENNLKLELPEKTEGNYYWRIQSQNYEDGPVVNSPTYPLKVEPLVFPKLPKINITKVKAKEIKLKEDQRAPIVDFSWEKTGRAKFYTIEIATDKDFNKIISKQKSSENNLSLTLPKKNTGKYYWRIQSQNYEDGPAVKSPTYDFKIKNIYVSPYTPAKLKQPANKKVIPEFYLLETGIDFRWETTYEDSVNSELQISRSRNFTTLAFRSKKQKEDSFLFKGALKPARYYWRIKQTVSTKNKKVNPFSKVYSFLLEGKFLSITTYRPKKEQLFTLDNTKTITYSWRKLPVNIKTKAVLSIAKDRAFKEITQVKQILDGKTRTILPAPKEAETYFWKVRIVSLQNNRTIAASPINELIIFPKIDNILLKDKTVIKGVIFEIKEDSVNILTRNGLITIDKEKLSNVKYD